MGEVKIKTDENGICKEFLIDGQPIGLGISKIELIIEAGKPVKLIMELQKEVEVECASAEIKNLI